VKFATVPVGQMLNPGARITTYVLMLILLGSLQDGLRFVDSSNELEKGCGLALHWYNAFYFSSLDKQ